MGAFTNGISKWWNGFVTKLGGIFGRGGTAMLRSPEAVEATFEAAEAQLKQRFVGFKKGVAGVVKLRNDASKEIAMLTGRITAEEKELKGARLIVEQEVRRLVNGGMTVEEAKASCAGSSNELVRKAVAAYTDLSSSVTRDKERLVSAQKNFEEFKAQIEQYKLDGEAMQRDQERLSREKAEAMVRLQVAESRRTATEQMAGVGTSNVDSLLADVRNIVSQAEAEAETAETMHGMDVRRSKLQFSHAAEQAAAKDALFGDMDLSDLEAPKKEADTDARSGDDRLPE